jgi:pyridoxal phosphate enzyme (YggS family)
MKVWTADLGISTLAHRYQHVTENIAEACRKAGRPIESVRLVAVTKFVPVDVMEAAAGLGIRDFGESRVQDAAPKKAQFTNQPIRWHFIGHLQTNKIKRVVGEFVLIHSVDSWKLAEALSREATDQGLVQPILVQVNTSGEPSKHGITPELTPAFIERSVSELPGLQVQGLMTMAPYSEDPEAARPFFRRLRELRDDVAGRYPGVSLDHLSMGMSGDYAVAIEEGATMIRIGTGLFGARPRD